MISSISGYFIPMIFMLIVCTGIYKKKNVYQDFIKGAENGITTVIGIMPTLIGLMVAVGVMRDSGLLQCVSDIALRLIGWTGIPGEIVPVAVVKMFSSSAATGLVIDVFKKYGTDSTCGRMVSIMMGSTETIFYTMSVYFMSVKINKSRWTLAGALLSMISGIIASVLLA